MKYNAIVNANVSIKLAESSVELSAGDLVHVSAHKGKFVLEAAGKKLVATEKVFTPVLEAVVMIEELSGGKTRKEASYVEAFKAGLSTREVAALVRNKYDEDADQIVGQTVDVEAMKRKRRMTIGQKLAKVNTLAAQDPEMKMEAVEEVTVEVLESKVELPVATFGSKLKSVQVERVQGFVNVHTDADSVKVLEALAQEAGQTTYVREGKLIIRESAWAEVDLANALLSVGMVEAKYEPVRDAQNSDEITDEESDERLQMLKRQALANGKKDDMSESDEDEDMDDEDEDEEMEEGKRPYKKSKKEADEEDMDDEDEDMDDEDEKEVKSESVKSSLRAMMESEL